MSKIKTKQAGTEAPKVTVLMAVYNGERYLREAVDSILGQTFTDFEFLIINDGSTDTSREILSTYSDPRILILENKQNIGLTKSLNRGLSLARGEYIARMDADDRSHSVRIERQVAYLDNHPCVAVLGTQHNMINAKGIIMPSLTIKRPVDPLAFRWCWIFDNPIAHSSAVFRKNIIWEILGGYNEIFRTSQDFELWSRVGRHSYVMCNLAEILLDFRVHEKNISMTYKTSDILKLEGVYLKNIEYVLKTKTFPKEFPSSWLNITMPNLKKNIFRKSKVLQMIQSIQNIFFFLYPEASTQNEIREHIITVIRRCSRYYSLPKKLQIKLLKYLKILEKKLEGFSALLSASIISLIKEPMSNCFDEIKKKNRFEFGKNWRSFLNTFNSVRIKEARTSLLKLLDLKNLRGKKFLDIGSGSGLFSLAAALLGASVTSFDYDPESVECAKYLRSKIHPGDSKWKIKQGSVLDKKFLKTLSQYDIVYSWGVLHHTGDMWQAFENVIPLVKENGLLCIAIYNDEGKASKIWRKIKWLYCSGKTGKYCVCIIYMPYFLGRVLISSIIQRKNLISDYKKNRGMSLYHDLLDWLGGFPYEVATVEEILNYMRAKGFRLKNLITSAGWGCNQFVFLRNEKN